MSPTVAIIIPTYEHFNFAKKATESVLANTPNSTVFLIDDASKDWDNQDWSRWPLQSMRRHHFKKNKGLTRSWNYGLRLARDLGFDYTVCTNSDVLFPPNWFDSIFWSLSRGADLAAPLTNAPGHRPKQQISRYIPGYKVTDSMKYLSEIIPRLREQGLAKAFQAIRLNGFCLVAKTSTWWQGAFSSEDVFNPKYRMTRNEDELQDRWLKKKKVLALALGSFVFHYRGVTRPGATKGRDGAGWYRPKK